jgi:hypothetical protein
MKQDDGYLSEHKGQDDGYLSVTLGRLAVISQLHGEGWLFSVRYIGQFFGYLSVT